MRTKCKMVYQFIELDENAKEKAREWYRAGDDMSDVGGCALDALAELCAALRMELDATKICWNVSWSQGDGSSFAARVNAARLLDAIAADTYRQIIGDLDLPIPPALHRMVRELLTHEMAFINAACGKSSGFNGHYTLRTEHDIDCYGLDNDRHLRITAQLEALGKWAESVLDTINDWFFRELRADIEFQSSDACIDEKILENEFEFDLCGNIA